MPELPEVETTKRNLERAGLAGLSVKAAAVGWERSVGGDGRAFERRAVGRTVVGLRRRGKYIVIKLDDDSDFVIHLRMSGRLNLLEARQPRNGYERVTLIMSDGRELRFHDPRKFGRFILTADAAAMLAHLAPEPLADAFTARYVRRYLKRRARMLKPLLLDQTALTVGVGNIYADEALWRARLHPQTLGARLKPAACDRLHEAIVAVLRRGVANFGTSLGGGLSNFKLPSDQAARNQERLQVFRRGGEPCYACQTPIERIIVGQRSTHICPRCQKI